jgi:hypothetical protein
MHRWSPWNAVPMDIGTAEGGETSQSRRAGSPSTRFGCTADVIFKQRAHTNRGFRHVKRMDLSSDSHARPCLREDV